MSNGVTWGIAWRSLKLIPRIPSTFIPSIMMPVVFVTALVGLYSGLVNLPGFPAHKAIDWFLPFTLLQGGAFAGITTGMGVARDLESGFYDRLLVSPASRRSLLAGPILAAMFRALIPGTFMVIAALVGGASFPGGAVGFATSAVALLGIAMAGGAWSLFIALKFKTQQSAPIMQVGLFLTMFLSTGQMPLNLLSGWLHTVASINPLTRILALAREGFLGPVTWSGTWPGLVAIAGLCTFLILLATRAMRKVIP